MPHASHVVVFLVVAAGAMLPSCDLARPPDQPESGPGGKDYAHAAVTVDVRGWGAKQYRVYEPADPTPETAPLIVFNHGWSITDPETYGGWIEHVVRRGNVVVMPRYQATALTPPGEFLDNIVAAVNDAIETLSGEGHVTPDLDRVAFVGHSTGGLMAANLAAIAATVGVPQAKAVFCVEPQGPVDFPVWDEIHEDLSLIPAGTLLLTIAGDADRTVGQDGATYIYNEATAVGADDKDYVLMIGDDYGWPALEANHLAPLARRDALAGGPRSIDALDFYGFWKLFDGLTDAAFYGTNREYALGDTPEQRFMGMWSDGTPVSELIVMDNP